MDIKLHSTDIKRTTVFCIIILATLFTLATKAQNGIIGFATYSDNGLACTIGGGRSEVVRAKTRDVFERMVSDNTPRTIILDANLTGLGLNDRNDMIEVGSNKTIIGSGNGKTLSGIGLEMNNQHNIIIRNLTITKGREDGISMRSCHHVWIDHCDLSASYDGLLDFTLGSNYMSVTHTKLHHHNKVSITNSGTCHWEDYGKERVTFAHCWFDSNTQRNPRIGYGLMHIYNCYWTNIKSYCIGYHSQAQVLSENNYFSESARNPFMKQYTTKLPYTGFCIDHGSFFGQGKTGSPTDSIHYTPTDYYNYSFDIVGTQSVTKEITANCGPRNGIEFEPILCPGNGAIDVPTDQRLLWSSTEGADHAEILFGTNKDKLKLTDVSTIRLKPSTTYYWKVVTAGSNGQKHASPLYSFTTAGKQASKPQPENGETSPWLRWPSSKDAFCTAMPLSWRNAADAVKYIVYLSTNKKQLDNNLMGETTDLSFNPGNLKLGKTYFWRVDAVTQSGKTIKGAVWNFCAPAPKWHVGRNEVEKLYRSGIAFIDEHEEYSGKLGTAGDQGPGAICGVWGGESGTYSITTISKDESLGENLIGISINNQLADAWLTDRRNGFGSHTTRRTLTLNHGDELRIEFVAGYVDNGLNEARARIDYVEITPCSKTFNESTPTHQTPHKPQITPGREYELIVPSQVCYIDTLGAVGEIGSWQVRKRYSSWISENEGKLTLTVRNSELIEILGKENSHWPLGFDKVHSFTTPTDWQSIKEIRLYRSTPSDTVFHHPYTDSELILTSDAIAPDSLGLKGNEGSTQITDEYAQWMKYTNLTGSGVTSAGRKAFISPSNDAPCETVPTGKNGRKQSIVVGTDKTLSLFVKHTSRAKLYFTGSSGSGTSLTIKVTNTDNGTSETIISNEAPGKDRYSATSEVELNPESNYHIEISGTSGDMCIYAVKLNKL